MEGRPPGDPLEPTEVGSDEGQRGSLAEGVKKAILAGMGALFLTEESARRVARDWKLPKELVGFIGQQATGAKDEILRVFAQEIRRFLESEVVRAEFWKALTDNAIEIRAEIRFRKDGAGAARPAVTASARAKRTRKAKG
jgi:hypothetical protein